MKITTDSTPVEAPKPVENSIILSLYRLFANETDYATMVADHHNGGTGYGDLKKRLADAYWDYFAPMRERRLAISQEPGYVEKILAEGADRARAEACKVLQRVRHAVGLV